MKPILLAFILGGILTLGGCTKPQPIEMKFDQTTVRLSKDRQTLYVGVKKYCRDKVVGTTIYFTPC